MLLTTRKLPAHGSTETRHLIEREGVPMGLLTKFKNTRTEDHPWKLFLYKTAFVPAETEIELIAVRWKKSWKKSRAELLPVAAEFLEERGL